MIEEKDIDLLFNEVLQEESDNKQELSAAHITEQQRLQVIHSLSENNIDDVFNNLIEYKDELIDDHIGKKYNQWTVLSFYGSNKHSIKHYICLCKCGVKRIATIPSIKRSPHCYNCRINRNSFIGKQFGHRKIINFKYINKKNVAVCECKCGSIDSVRLTDLINREGNQCKKCDIEERKQKYLSISVINEKYGNRTIISERIPKYIANNKIIYYVKCICICGVESLTSYNILKSGRAQSCKTCQFKICKIKTSAEKINKQYGNWKIISHCSIKSNSTCECICGNIQIQKFTRLKSNDYSKCKICKIGPTKKL